MGIGTEKRPRGRIALGSKSDPSQEIVVETAEVDGELRVSVTMRFKGEAGRFRFGPDAMIRVARAQIEVAEHIKARAGE